MDEVAKLTFIVLFSVCCLIGLISWFGVIVNSLRVLANTKPGAFHGWAKFNTLNVVLYPDRLTENGRRLRVKAGYWLLTFICSCLTGVLIGFGAYLLHNLV
jgi:hypothetical protein